MSARGVEEGSLCWLAVGCVRLEREGRSVELWWKLYPEFSAVEGRWAKDAVRMGAPVFEAAGWGWSGFVGMPLYS